MYKLAAIIGGVLLVAGVALAGTLTSLDSTNGRLPSRSPRRSAARVSRRRSRGRWPRRSSWRAARPTSFCST